MFSSVVLSAALLSLANAHGVILGAQGEAGSPPSVGFQVDPNVARNCTGISPCQQDTTIIRDAEIASNVVNECGRTELTGNIDVGENTEAALAAGAVTAVKAGTNLAVTIHQVNADGAGPYTCDLDQTSNTGVISQNLTVTNNVPGVNGLSQNKTQAFTINVAMPDNLACVGASTGNVCTVRCRNNAQAGPFGGCFAVQQTDTTPSANSANQLQTAQGKDAINAQVAQNQKDFAVAVAANQQQGSAAGLKANADAAALAGLSFTSKEAAVQTLSVANVGQNVKQAVATTTLKAAAQVTNVASAGTAAAAAATTTAATAKASKCKANKNNNKRSLGNSMKWAKRALDGGI